MADQFDTRVPFRRSDAVQAGISDNALRSGRFKRILDGVHIASDVQVDAKVMAQALLLVSPDSSWVSHASAARWHGCPLPPLPDEHVTVPTKRARIRRAGVRCHLAAAGSRVLATSRVSAAEQCFVELAEQLPLVDLVIVGDWLVRTNKVTLDSLVSYCAASRHRNAAAARRAAAYVRERVDSPMETRLRMLIVLAGLPEPLVNVSVTVGGVPVRRYDLCWPQARVIVEYDGRHHVEVVEQWEADLQRREAIDDDQWRILVVTSKGIFDRPDQTLQRVHRLLRKHRLPGTPATLADGWRAHFPVKASA